MGPRGALVSTLARIADVLERDEAVDHLVVDLSGVPAAVLAKPVSDWTTAELGLVSFPEGPAGDAMRRAISAAAGVAVPLVAEVATAAIESELRR